MHFSRFFSRRPFRLVVDFPRSSFRLCTSSIGLALRACIGGSPGDLFVAHQKHWSNSFLVCSKAVGIWIYNLRSFICKDYHARFHLWRDGGPNWQREWRLWSAEQNSEWTLVPRKSKKQSAARSKPVKTVSSPKLVNPPRVSSSLKPNITKSLYLSLVHSSKGADSKFQTKNVIPVKSIFARLRFPEITVGKTPVRAQRNCDPPLSADKKNSILDRPKTPPFCDHCLSHGHREFECVNMVKCASCRKLNHRAAVCWNKKKAHVWRPKTVSKPDVGGAGLGKEIVCFTNQGNPSSSSHQRQSVPLLLPASLPSASPSASMAVVNPDPALFLPPTIQLHEPWDHQLECVDLCLQEDPPRRNEGMVVACIEPPPTPDQFEGFQQLAVNYVQNVLGYHVLEVNCHPVEFLYVRVASTLLRDTLIAGGPYEVDNQFMLRFVPHDLTSSCRNSPFTVEGWVMFLDFPLDFKTPTIIDKAVSLFGKVVKVQLDDNIRGRLLVKALYSSALEVPKRIVIKRAAAFGGVGRSWTVSVFLCHGEMPDIMPGDEDLPPVNHIPIPDPVPQLAHHVEVFGDNMQEDAPANQHISQNSALSVVAGSHNMVLQNQGIISFEHLVQPRFLINLFFWRILSAFNTALSTWEGTLSVQNQSPFRLLQLSPQWSLDLGPPQDL